MFGEAILEYLPADFKVQKAGDYVICTHSQKEIPLSELKYWSVEYQEAYIDCEASYLRTCLHKAQQENKTEEN